MPDNKTYWFSLSTPINLSSESGSSLIRKLNKKMEKKKIATKKKESPVTGKMTFAEILENHPNSAEILFNSGMHCIGCGMAMYESLEDGCTTHGMSKKEIDELIKKLNKKK